MAPPDDGFETIQVDPEGAVARITLNRPEKLNALNTMLLGELGQALRAFDSDRAIKVVVIRGNGRAFTAGADLKELSGLSQEVHAEHLRHRSELAREAARLLSQIRPITVAELHGRVVGGGVVLMVACDVRIAADDTVFQIPEVSLGAPLGWGGIPRLVRELGAARTRELVLLERPILAHEAVAVSLINEAVPSERLAARTHELATTLASRTSLALAGTKRHINAVLDQICDPGRSYADDDALVLSILDPQTARARAEYTARTVGGEA